MAARAFACCRCSKAPLAWLNPDGYLHWGDLNLFGLAIRWRERGANQILWGDVSTWTDNNQILWGDTIYNPQGQQILWGDSSGRRRPDPLGRSTAPDPAGDAH